MVWCPDIQGKKLFCPGVVQQYQSFSAAPPGSPLGELSDLLIHSCSAFWISVWSSGFIAVVAEMKPQPLNKRGEQGLISISRTALNAQSRRRRSDLTSIKFCFTHWGRKSTVFIFLGLLKTRIFLQAWSKHTEKQTNSLLYAKQKCVRCLP